MSPDDPRHGTHRGYLAHRRAGSDPCAECRHAHFRSCKATKHRLAHGDRRRVPLGQEAHAIIAASTLSQLAAAAGLRTQQINRLAAGGPDQIVLVTTRDAILAARTWTVVGIQRRLRALAAIGWSGAMIADQIDSWRDTVQLAQTQDRTFVRPAFGDRVVALYETAQHQPRPDRGPSRYARRRAQQNGWYPPAMWDDIDLDPDPTPLGADYVDHAVVERILAGDTVPATAAERLEVIRRWPSTGRSLNELERTTGWNVRRYLQEAS